MQIDEVERRIGLAYAAAGLKHRVVAYYLADIDARGLHQLAGCRTTAQYAAARFGMSRREARDLLAAGRALRGLTLIDRAFAEGRLCWSKVRELIKVAVAKHEEAWLASALDMSTDELALEVRLSRHGDRPRKRDERKGLPEIRVRLNTALPPDVYAKWEQVRRKIRNGSGNPLQEWECLEAMIDRELARTDDDDGGGVISPYTVVVHPATDEEDATVETEDGPRRLDDGTAEMLACTCGVIDPSLGDHEADRRVSHPRRRRVLARDQRRCRSCGCRHRLHIHHIVPVSRGGRTVMRNLITLCRSCHALLHAGLLVILGNAKTARFLTKDGRPLPGPGAPPDEFLPQPPPLIAVRMPTTPMVQLKDVPTRIDQAWWRHHAHMLRWVGRRGVFEFRPGTPADGDRGPRDAAPEVGTACQPRPRRLTELVGQPRVVRALRTATGAARRRGRACSHILLTGPPGLGKTTMARAIASDLGVTLHSSTGPFIGSMQALVNILVDLDERDVLFIDEVHALAPGVAVALYQAVEDGWVNLTLSSDALARCVTLELPPFTLVGATTDAGLLPVAFLQRFVYRQFLDFYTTGDLAEIITRAAARFGMRIEPRAAQEVARVSRGTPRCGISLLRRLCDEAVIDERAWIAAEDVA